MKNKFKALFAAFVGLFAFSAVAVGVNAETLAYNVDNETKTSYATDEAMYSDTIANVYANRSLTVAPNKSTATAENDSTLTFTKGLLPGGNCNNTTANSALKVTSVVDGATIGVYYTFSDSGFSSKDQSKPASLVIYSSGDTKLKTFDSVAGSNKVAYYSEYSISGAGTTVYVGSSGSRLIVMGFVIKEGVATVTHTVTIKNALNTAQTLAELVVEDGSTASFSSNIWGYDFKGLFVDEACTTKYTDVITADTVLYANYTPWADGTISSPYNLSSQLISKVDGLSNLGSEINLTGTIYTLLASTTYATTNNAPCISTGGKVSLTNKGIKIQVPAKGYITTLMTTGGTSARNAKLIDSEKNVVEVSSGNAVWNANEAKNYEQRTLVYEVEAGTYYLGGDNDMKVLSVEFTPYVNLNYQLNKEYTDSEGVPVAAGSQIRFVGTVNCLTADTLADATASLKVTLDGKTGSVSVETVYTSVAIDESLTFAEASGVYYIVIIVSGLDAAELKTKVLTAQLDVIVGGTTYSSEVKTYKIA